MKKLFLTTAIILSFVIGSNAQQNTGGLIKRGGDRMTRDDEAGLYLPGDGYHGIGGNADGTDTYYDDTEWNWQSHIHVLTVNPTSLSGFQYAYNAGPSEPQSFTVTGFNLNADVTVTAPSDFEISLNTSGVYSNSCSIAPTGDGSVSSTVYVRMKAGLSTGSHTGTLTVACGNLSKNIALSGTVSEPTSELTVNPTSLSGFLYASGAGPSDTQSFTVTGSYLSADVTVTAPEDFEISLNNSGVYSNSCSITPADGSVSSTVYVRMKAGLSTGSHTGTLTVEYGDLSQDIDLSGTVNELTVNPTSLSGFQYAYNAGPSETQNFTVTGSYLSANVTVTAPEDFEITLNTSDAYSSSCSITPTDGSVSSTVYVRMKANLSEGSYTGTLTVACGALSQNIALSGTVAEPTTISGGYWNDSTTWQNGEVPSAVDVIINGPVTIPADYTANAATVTIIPGAQLIIEPGGQLYHSNEVSLTMQMDITGYDSRSGDGGYYLIAAPAYTDTINHTIPVASTHLNTGTFDLYAFDQNYSSAEWRNFKAGEFDALTLGQGYLYANSANDTIVFDGQTMPTNADISIDLVYNGSVNWKGWNLVGNPFTCGAYVDKAFYTMNDNGDEIIYSTSNTVEVTEGIFVVATGEGQSVTFSTIPANGKSALNINLSQGRGIVDRASILFNEGDMLPKFQLNPNHTKVYIPMDGKDYAVVNAEEMGEMPVSFKAENNGTYNMSFTAEEVSFNYLHLIDNMTGADVDLLATPSYTFEANTTDCANRFKLVFASGDNSNDDNDNDNFAFMSNGHLVINNEGNATVQVIDVTGRILSSESINGSASINVNGAVGVYMIRLINGNDVKVQKIVVR